MYLYDVFPVEPFNSNKLQRIARTVMQSISFTSLDSYKPRAICTGLQSESLLSSVLDRCQIARGISQLLPVSLRNSCRQESLEIQGIL
jgi:hypothetical protein